MTIAEFVAARLSEEESDAEAAETTVLPPGFPRETHLVYGLESAGFGLAYQGFTLIHDPARALRDVAFNRVVVALHDRVHDCPIIIPVSDPERFAEGMYVSTERIEEGETCTTLLSLAGVWSDHADYRPEWAAGAATTTTEVNK